MLKPTQLCIFIFIKYRIHVRRKHITREIHIFGKIEKIVLALRKKNTKKNDIFYKIAQVCLGLIFRIQNKKKSQVN